jgi:hypothetical protein
MFTAKNAKFNELAKQAGIKLTDEIEFFAELVAEECADIANSAAEVDLPAAPIIRRHFSLLAPKQ